MDALEDYAAGIERQLFEQVAARIAGLEDTQRHFNAVLEGSVGTKLERINGVALKLAKKLNKSADQRLSNAYSYALELGGHYPAKEDVIYGLQTGDYLGSMGVAPPIGPNGTGPAIADPMTPTAPAAPRGPGGIEPGIIPEPDEPPTDPVPPWQTLPPSGGIIEDPTFPPAPGPVGGGIPVSTSCGPAVMAFAATAAVGDYFAWATAGAGGCTLVPANVPQYLAPPIPQNWCNLWGEDPTTGGMLFQVLAPCGCTLWVPEGGGDAIVCCGPPPAGYCMVFANVQGGVGGTGPVPGEPPPDDGKVCPTPNPVTCGPSPTFANLLAELAGGDDVCDLMNKALTETNALPTQVGDWIRISGGVMSKAPMVDYIISSLIGGDEPVLTSLINRFANWLQKGSEVHARSLKCGDAQAIPLAAKQAILGFIQQWTGSVPPPVMKFLNQMWDWICPTNVPTGPETDEAWLADGLTKDEWECYHKMNGDHLGPAKKVVDTKRARVSAREADILRRRGYIDADTFLKRARGVGVLRDEDALDIMNLNVAWPALADVVRFMVRDVEDENIVQFSRLDEDFDLKYTGQTEKYGEALGVDRDLAKRYWRAHWQLPSFTMLSEMLHRLRPGTVDAAVQVTEEDVRTCLKQDDWAPGWVDRMMAISYSKVTRTDATRMFELHAIDEQDLKNYLRDNGYTDQDAAALTDYYARRRKVQEVKRSGLPTARTLINQYARGETTQREFTQVAQKISLNDDQAQAMVESAELARTVRNRTQMIKGIRANYLHGIIDEPEAHEALSDAGVDGDEVGELVQQWTLERSARAKMPTAERLCKWRALGLIGPADQARALVRLNWDSDDAYRIVTTCGEELDEKQKQAAAKAAKAAARQYVHQRVETVRQCTERQKAKKGDPCADPQPRPVVG